MLPLPWERAEERVRFHPQITAALFSGLEVRRLPRDIQSTGLRKLKLIDAAIPPESLRVPPGNRLEALRGDRRGQWSIRINDQWRICFRWKDGDAFDVEIVDCHHQEFVTWPINEARSGP